MGRPPRPAGRTLVPTPSRRASITAAPACREDTTRFCIASNQRSGRPGVQGGHATVEAPPEPQSWPPERAGRTGVHFPVDGHPPEVIGASSGDARFGHRPSCPFAQLANGQEGHAVKQGRSTSLTMPSRRAGRTLVGSVAGAQDHRLSGPAGRAHPQVERSSSSSQSSTGEGPIRCPSPSSKVSGKPQPGQQGWVSLSSS